MEPRDGVYAEELIEDEDMAAVIGISVAD